MKKKVKPTKLKRDTNKPVTKKKLESGPSAAEIRRTIKATEKLKDKWDKDVEDIYTSISGYTMDIGREGFYDDDDSYL